MGKNPLNLALRFFLELAALVAFGYYGWIQFGGALRYLLAFGLPIIAAALWGTFRVPGDGGKPIIRVPGIIRLLIEAAFFGLSVWCLFDAGAKVTGWIFASVILIHYLISYDRIAWLLKK
jgi:hypothetical protein